MTDTVLVIIEILKVIGLMALFPAQIAWGLVTSGSGLRALFGVGIFISVYGGLVAAMWRGSHRLIFGPSRRPRRRRGKRRTTP